LQRVFEKTNPICRKTLQHSGLRLFYRKERCHNALEQCDEKHRKDENSHRPVPLRRAPVCGKNARRLASWRQKLRSVR
jgi:hypothetical protein